MLKKAVLATARRPTSGKTGNISALKKAVLEQASTLEPGRREIFDRTPESKLDRPAIAPKWMPILCGGFVAVVLTVLLGNLVGIWTLDAQKRAAFDVLTAFCVAGLLGGSAMAYGRLPLPGAIAAIGFTVGGSTAVFVIVLLILRLAS